MEILDGLVNPMDTFLDLCQSAPSGGVSAILDGCLHLSAHRRAVLDHPPSCRVSRRRPCGSSQFSPSLRRLCGFCACPLVNSSLRSFPLGDDAIGKYWTIELLVRNLGFGLFLELRGDLLRPESFPTASDKLEDVDTLARQVFALAGLTYGGGGREGGSNQRRLINAKLFHAGRSRSILPNAPARIAGVRLLRFPRSIARGMIDKGSKTSAGKGRGKNTKNQMW